MTDAPEPFIFYRYNPSLAAAIIFVILFLATTGFHAIQLFKNRTWYFVPFFIGGIFESIGYIGRAISAKQSPDWTPGPYSVQSVMTLLAPTLFAASIYMILGRIIRLTDGEEHSLIRAKWLTKVFVGGDVISFLVQSGGGGYMSTATTQNGVKTGQHLITGGLVIQVIFFGFFMVVAGLFHKRITSRPTPNSMVIQVPWKKYLIILYIASIFIMIRSVFRIVEYVQGNDGTLLKTEIYVYLFDALLMFLTMVVFNVQHPSQIISKASLKSNTRAGQISGSSYEFIQSSIGLASRENV